MTSRSLTAGAMAVGLLVARAAAQSCTVGLPAGNCPANTTASLTIGNVLQLTLSATTTTLTAPTRADYVTGYVQNAGPSVTVSSNAAWHVTIAAAAATWTATNTVPGVSARANKPAGDLRWATASGGPYSALSTTAATVVSTTATASTVRSIFFRTLYNSTVDTPGQYALSVVFTVSAP